MNWLRISIWLICAVGFQVYFFDVSYDYLTYQTVTTAYFDINPRFEYYLQARQRGLSWLDAYDFSKIRNDTIIRANFTINGLPLELEETVCNKFKWDEEGRECLRKIQNNFTLFNSTIISYPYRYRDLFFISISIDGRQLITLGTGSYQVITRHLLKAPYDTNCFNYYDSEQNLKTRRQMIDNCNVNLKRRIPIEVDVDEFDNLPKYNETCLKGLQRQDCINLQVLKFDYDSTLRRTVNVTISILHDISMLAFTTPQINIFMYVIYSLGLVGSFANFCISDFLHAIRRYARRLVKKTARRMSSQKIIPVLKPFWKLNKISIWFFCTSACIYHIHFTVSQYIEYEHSSNIYLSSPSNVLIPKISFCYQMTDLSQIKLDPSEILSDATLKYSDSNAYTVCSRREICFVLSPYRKPIYGSESLDRYLLNYKVKDYAALNISQFSVYLYPSNEHFPMRGEPKDGFMGSFKRYRERTRKYQEEIRTWTTFSTITPMVTELHLLEKPYSTKCSNYADVGSRANCYNHNKKLTCNGTGATEPKNDHSCIARQCRQTYWKSVSTKYEIQDEADYSYILFPSQSLSISLEPSITLTNLYISCLAVISFWIGICFIHLADKIDMLLTEARNIVPRILKTAIIISFWLLALVNINYVFIDYFKYPIVSNLDYEVPKVFEPPFFSYNYVTLGRHGKIPIKNRSIDYLSPIEKYNRFSDIPDGLVEIVVLKNNESLRINGENLANYLKDHTVVISMNQWDVYTTIDLKTQLEDMVLRKDSPIFGFHFQRKGYFGFGKVYFHYDSIQEIDLNSVVDFYDGPDVWVSVNHLVSLPYPYSTKCVKQQVSFRDCLIEKFKSIGHTLPFEVPIPVNETGKLEYMTKYPGIVKFCRSSHRRRTPCSGREVKVARIVETAGLNPIVRVTTRLDSYITCTLKPKMTILMLSISLGGAIEVWLGINFYSILNLIADIVENVKEKVSKTKILVVKEDHDDVIEISSTQMVRRYSIADMMLERCDPLTSE